MDILWLLLLLVIVSVLFPGQLVETFSTTLVPMMFFRKNHEPGLLPKDILPDLEQAKDVRERIQEVRKQERPSNYKEFSNNVVVDNGWTIGTVSSAWPAFTVATASSFMLVSPLIERMVPTFSTHNIGFTENGSVVHRVENAQELIIDAQNTARTQYRDEGEEYNLLSAEEFNRYQKGGA